MLINQTIQPNETHGIKVIEELAAGHTGTQYYRIVELANYGKCLIINGCIQSTERDESFYHEALLFPAAMLHGNVKRVLCFGGANGGIINRLAFLPHLDAVTQVDVDETLYQLSKEYLPHMHLSTRPSFSLNLFFEGPIAWIKKHGHQYDQWADLIICDLPDATEDSYAANLFTRNFYHLMKPMLASDGIFVTQAGQGHVFAMDFHQRAKATLASLFKTVNSYCHFVPSYGVPWAFALASDVDYVANISSTDLQMRINHLPASRLISYDLITHQHMFHLPKYFRHQLSKQVGPIDVDNMAYVKVDAT
jgi:spermidine synthase